MKKREVNKNDCMDFHVIKRFRQRFHMSIGQSDIKEIVGLITSGNSEPVYALSNAKKVHIVNFRDVRFCCVYNKLRRHIHTVFPVEWLEDGSLDEYLKRKGYVEVCCE